MKKQILTLVLCLAASVAFAQHHHGDGKIDELKKEFIKTELKLTDAEADKFFPVYDEYQEKKDIIRLEQMLEFKKFKAKTNPTEAESKAFTTKMLELDQKEVDLRKEYVAKFEEIIGAQKTAMLFIVEVEFKKKMLHSYKERHEKKDGSKAIPQKQGE